MGRKIPFKFRQPYYRFYFLDVFYSSSLVLFDTVEITLVPLLYT